MSDDINRSYALQQSGLERFREQGWTEAIQLFTEAKQLSPEDRVPELYLERIHHYQLHPPGDDWDGVWTMQSK